MRYPAKNAQMSCYFVAGTYVVLMGFDATEEACKGLLGFAVHRVDKTENEEYWLKGFRTFESTYKNPPKGTLVSTQEHPVQDFVWSDFTAKPNHKYVYKVVPVYGKPKSLKYGEAIEQEVDTESEGRKQALAVSDGENGNEDAIHSIYFNRGVIGSQAYAREFHNINPDKLRGQEQQRAFRWLSRGLQEAMLQFINQADRPNLGLRASVYEFSYEPAVAAFGAALKKCKDVKIIYDARIPTSGAKNIAASKKRVKEVERLLTKYGLIKHSTPRTEDGNFISHNKFIVLLENGKPKEVWTGSTNFTESGIFGQSNVGHVIRDDNIATAYLDYWTRLQKDPSVADIRQANESANKSIQNYPPAIGATPIFSPRQGLGMLEWYSVAMGKALQEMCFTAAFGINKVFYDVLQKQSKGLNYIFLDKWSVKKADAAKIQKVLAHDIYNQVAVGSYLGNEALIQYLDNRWAKETLNPLSKNVRYVHSKYMLVDPLGDGPIVITGSANFSDASTKQNDENMVVIRGDKRVADIYLGEFMRLWQHYRYRYIENAIAEKGQKNAYKPNYLSETDKWVAPYYKKDSVKYRKRRAFAGPKSINA